LAATTHVARDFYYAHGDEVVVDDEYNFRKGLTATERLKKKVAAQASLFGLVVGALKQQVTLPALNVPSFPATDDQGIEEAAEKARVHWGLGVDGPVDNMTRVLEHAGVVTVLADEETAEKVDAFSRYGKTSIVVLNTAKGSTSRSFFDTAHEAGHGVLHFRCKRPSTLEKREEEADRFASAFLMPKRPFTRDFWGIGKMNWSGLLEMKARWGTSIAAIIMRAYQLGLLDAAGYRTGFRDLSRRGWRTTEPEEPEPEKPELFGSALSQYAKVTGKSPRKLASELHFTPSLFTSITRVRLPTAEGVTSLADYRRRIGEN
jgi:Zn-dependent peptidase ImmA (M78 family)